MKDVILRYKPMMNILNVSLNSCYVSLFNYETSPKKKGRKST